MKIEHQDKNGIKVIALEGKIMGTPEDEVFLEMIDNYAGQGEVKVVLDLSGVNWMSSRGISLFIRALTTLRNRDGDLRLARLSPNARSLLEKTRLLSSFKHYKTIEKAVGSFG